MRERLQEENNPSTYLVGSIHKPRLVLWLQSQDHWKKTGTFQQGYGDSFEFFGRDIAIDEDVETVFFFSRGRHTNCPTLQWWELLEMEGGGGTRI